MVKSGIYIHMCVFSGCYSTDSLKREVGSEPYNTHTHTDKTTKQSKGSGLDLSKQLIGD